MWEVRDARHAAASLRVWSRRAHLRHMRRARRDLSDAQQLAEAAAARADESLAQADGARSRYADAVLRKGEAVGRASSVRTLARVFGAWRRLLDAEKRREELAEREDAIGVERRQLEERLSSSAIELEAVRAKLMQSEQREREVEQRAKEAAAAHSALTRELREQLRASEQRVRTEAERAAQSEDQAARMEEELQAVELRALWNDQKAAQQAENFHEQLSSALVVSPGPRSGAGSWHAGKVRTRRTVPRGSRLAHESTARSASEGGRSEGEERSP